MDTQDILLTIFTGILAVAVLMQTLVFFGTLRTIRQLTSRMERLSGELIKHVEAVSQKTNETLDVLREISESLIPVKDRMVHAADIVHQRIVRIDGFLEETTDAARLEVHKLRSRIESASNRVEQMLEDVQDCVMTPVNEISAITRGIRAGFDLLFRRRKHAAAEVEEPNEEMFI